jgi:pyruvate,water dikinase
VLFSARKYVSNGRVPPISHVVLVDPEGYSALPDAEHLKRVGRAIGRLNSLLPKRQFLLMGPGRWGSRGDIRLGVPVSYSEINNTAALIEIARKKGNYLPDLSFGTHFFQDLVEAGIRYLPLYPDESGILYNQDFLRSASNVLPELLPEYADLSAVLRVIDVPSQTGGQVLWLALNADADQALAYLDSPGTVPQLEKTSQAAPALEAGEHWRWRMRMAERLGRQLDPRRFGVVAAYVIGSSKNATAGPASDLDLLIHFRGSEQQRRELLAWLEGWSLSLAEMNYVRTGIRLERLLDVHLVSDEDVSRRSSYAVKIGAVTDPARPLPLGQ